MSKHSLWLVYALVTTAAWGAWGALIDLPAEKGFPATLGYAVWSLTMIPPAIVALWNAGWKLEYDARSICLGCVVGALGAGGQLILFQALRLAPAHLIFAYVALSPLVTIVLALVISRERAAWMGWLGIGMAIAAGIFLAWAPPKQNAESGPDKPKARIKIEARAETPATNESADTKANPKDVKKELPQEKGGVESTLWIVLASLVLLAWGIQSFVISHANKTMRAESIFFYMMLTAILIAPIAIPMTDTGGKPVNWGATGLWSAVAIQFLNSIGALLLVYAFRYGKAVIVAPLINAGAPVITIGSSLLIFRQYPTAIQSIGIVLAIVAALLMAIEEEQEAEEEGSGGTPEAQTQ